MAEVIYPYRKMVQENINPYGILINSDQLVRIFLDELPPAPPDNFEMGILELIAAQPEAAMVKAQAMVPRVLVVWKPSTEAVRCATSVQGENDDNRDDCVRKRRIYTVRTAEPNSA